MTRVLLLLALAACGGKKDPPPAATRSGSGSAPALGVIEPLKAGDDLSFAIDDIALHQKPSDATPWHAAGGTFTYFSAHLTADPKATFVFGVPEQTDSMSRNGWLAPTTADAGARIVAAYAQVFSVPPPGPVAGAKLAPVKILMAALGDNGGKDPGGGFSGEGTWSTYKWFCSAGDVDGAEVFFNFSLAEKAGEWSEKDPDDDADVARFLAMVLRDGVPAPRSPANDPTLAATGPTLTFGKRPIAPSGPNPIGLTPERIVFRNGDNKHAWVTAVVPATGAATELYRTADSIENGACGGDVCALASQDRATRAGRVVILGRGKPASVPIGGELLFVSAVSPDGKWVIVRTDWALAAIDVATHAVTRMAQPGDSFSDTFAGWTDRSGVGHVFRTPRDAVTPVTSGTWDVRASAAMSPVPTVGARPLRSPGGEREITIADTGVVTVVAGGAPRTFTLYPYDRGAPSPECCTWIDDRWVMMLTEREQVWIDTDALKVSLAKDAAFFDVVPGAHLAVARRDDGWYLATITPPP